MFVFVLLCVWCRLLCVVCCALSVCCWLVCVGSCVLLVVTRVLIVVVLYVALCWSLRGACCLSSAVLVVV